MVDYKMKAEPEDRTRFCCIPGCNELAKYSVGFLFFTEKTGRPVRAKTKAKVCERHVQATVDNFFSNDKSWETIEGHFAAAGLQMPKRELTQIIVE